MGRRKNNIPSKIFKFILSVVVLSAFIIGIALLIKGIQGTDQKKFAASFSKLLAKANINVEEEKVGEVAGKLVERVASTNISASSTSRLSDTTNSSNNGNSGSKNASSRTPSLEVALIADVEEDLASLTRALNLIRERHINKVIVLGDLTNFGELEDLQDVKNILDESGLTYYALPGDHDLAQSLSADNFVQVFGKTNYVVDMEGFNFVFLDNSANFTPLLASTVSWFNDESKTADFVILSQPLFVDGLSLPFSRLYMGSTLEDPSEDLVENQQRVRAQRDALLGDVQNASASAIFAGDHHKANKVVDGQRDNLLHYTLNAVTTKKEEFPRSLLNPTPGITVLTVYNDASFDTEEIIMD